MIIDCSGLNLLGFVNTNYRGTQEKDCQEWQTHKKKKWKRTIVSKKEKSCSSPMWFKHSMSIAQQLIPIYNTTVYKNKELCCPKCDCLCHNLTTPTGHEGVLNKTTVHNLICLCVGLCKWVSGDTIPCWYWYPDTHPANWWWSVPSPPYLDDMLLIGGVRHPRHPSPWKTCEIPTKISLTTF